MRCDLKLDAPEHLLELAKFLGLNDCQTTVCYAPINTNNLTQLFNVCYSVGFAKSYRFRENLYDIFDSQHVIYVDPDGYHYSWGKKYTTPQIMSLLSARGFDAILSIVKINENELGTGNLASRFPMIQLPEREPHELKASRWGFDGWVAAIQALCSNSKNVPKICGSDSFILGSELKPWLNNPGDRMYEDLVKDFVSTIFGPAGSFSFSDTLKKIESNASSIPFATPPMVMKRLIRIYNLAGFKVQQPIASVSKLTTANLKYRNTIYGFGSTQHQLHNGLLVWAYVDANGFLYMDGNQIPPDKIIPYLQSSPFKIDKISQVARSEEARLGSQ